VHVAETDERTYLGRVDGAQRDADGQGHGRQLDLLDVV